MSQCGFKTQRMGYWLMKSEPTCFSIDDLAQRPNKITHWDGVRNYQARNMMRDDMKKGDLAFFYHSSCNPPGFAGIVKIVKEAYPDNSAWHPESDHYDPKSTPDKPLWYMVDVQLMKKFKSLLSLEELRAHPLLQDLLILRKGNRLSITPVTEEQWRVIQQLTDE